MRLIKMTGGLGNQMFIYAFYMAMKRKFPHTRIDLSDMMHYHVHNGYELHRIFPHLPQDEYCIRQWVKKVVEFLFFTTILERKQNLTTLRPFFKRRLWPFVYFKGFYQSERYFKEIEDEVRETFRFDESAADEKTRRLLERIDADPLAVSLHVRRGDYLHPSVWRNTGCVCRTDYYRDAVALITQRLGTPHFYVFSDDIDWVTKNIPLNHATFVSWNKGKDSWQDMMLMSRCKHNILCNSTFSWWGGWLNDNAQKMIIVPDRWSALGEMPYICPEAWIKVPVTLPENL